MAEWTEVVEGRTILRHYLAGVIWEAIESDEIFQIFDSSRGWTGGLGSGGDEVRIPNEANPVGQTIPDLAVYALGIPKQVLFIGYASSEERALALIDSKRLRLEIYEVDPPKYTDDLDDLVCISPSEGFPSRLEDPVLDHKLVSNRWLYWFSWKGKGSTLSKGQKGKIQYRSNIQQRSNHEIASLIESIRTCSPGYRRQLMRALRDVPDIRAKYPLSPLNPKYKMVQSVLEDFDH